MQASWFRSILLNKSITIENILFYLCGKSLTPWSSTLYTNFITLHWSKKIRLSRLSTRYRVLCVEALKYRIQLSRRGVRRLPGLICIQSLCCRYYWVYVIANLWILRSSSRSNLYLIVPFNLFACGNYLHEAFLEIKHNNIEDSLSLLLSIM